jgi:putative hemolysin
MRDPDSRLLVEVTREPRRVAQAQRLRYRVFADELGAPVSRTGIDEDRWDAFCDHIIVSHSTSGEVVGTYRILPPCEAVRAGGYYAEQLFDLGQLDVLRDRMVEVGRACVHPNYRTGGNVLMLMWSTLARYLIDNRHDYVMAGASVALTDGGDAAASLYRQARTRSMSPEDYRVRPRCSLPLESLRETLPVSPPPLLRAYMNLGAWVSGEPAWDPVFDCADFPILLPLARMHARYARHFLAQAA